MKAFLELPNKEKRDIILESANLKGVSPVIIEKDFWVCWVLGKISETPELAEHVTFKGGTSLSKVFGLIERFSEDIDLAFKRSYLGFGGDKEPEEASSKKQVEKRIQNLTDSCVREIRKSFLPSMYDKLQKDIKDADSWALKIDENDPQTVFFEYPSVINSGVEDYIKPAVKIEMGARSDDWPTIDGLITSYIEECFKDLFNQGFISIKTLSSERTFWEKATILHAEYHRSEDKKTAMRISRHYYDLHQMHIKGVSKQALLQMDLLERVAKHKSVFFRSSWAKYEEAKPGTLRLMPKVERISDLKKDYDRMSEMFFGDYPSFNSILDSLRDLERSININS